MRSPADSIARSASSLALPGLAPPLAKGRLGGVAPSDKESAALERFRIVYRQIIGVNPK